jgi:hypothetical protein
MLHKVFFSKKKDHEKDVTNSLVRHFVMAYVLRCRRVCDHRAPRCGMTGVARDPDAIFAVYDGLARAFRVRLVLGSRRILLTFGSLRNRMTAIHRA